MPSPTSSTRPICSACGPSVAAPSLSARARCQPGIGSRRQSRRSLIVVSSRRSPPGCASRSARQLLLIDKMRAAQFQAGDQRRVDREGDLRIGAEALRRSVLAIPSCSVGIERRRADASKVAPFAATACRAGSGRARDLLQQPVQKRGAHGCAVQARGEASGDCRPPSAARAFAPGLLRRPARCLVDRRLRRAPAALPRLRAASARHRGARSLLGVSRAAARIASRSCAKPARVLLDLRQRGRRPRRVGRFRLGQIAGARRGVARSWRRPDARRSAAAARSGSATLTVWRPSVHQSIVMRHFSSGLANSSSSAITRQ